VILKIAWAGPWNIRSSIAMNFGVDVVAALAAEGHTVEVLRSEIGDCLEIPMPETPWVVHHLTDMPAERRRAEYDAVIANLGDHFGYHGALAPMLSAPEAVLIIHDAFLGHYCGGWAQLFPDPDQALRAMVRTTYGPEALSPEVPYWVSLDEMMRRRPMIELFAGNAMGAVVHARHYLNRVASVCPGPVVEIPLSSRDLNIVPPPLASETLVIATIGHVNANKQITEVIRAIGSSTALRACCRYVVIGPIEPDERQRIEAMMSAHNVTAVEFTGWIDDDALRDRLAGVDAICCLRFPILEGGSGSVIVAMLSGRAVLVSDHGVYGELPDNVVLKCHPGAEAVDIARHLESLLADHPARLAYGARARTYALRVNSPKHYAHALMALVERALAAGPAVCAGVQLGQILGSFGLASDDPAAHAAAAALTGLLGLNEGDD